jgi:hypothetical protein
MGRMHEGQQWRGGRIGARWAEQRRSLNRAGSEPSQLYHLNGPRAGSARLAERGRIDRNRLARVALASSVGMPKIEGLLSSRVEEIE